MKKLIISFFLVVSLFMLGMRPVFATEAFAGDLIRCPDFSAVYYVAENGTRWVFPNAQTYHTWFADFEDVKTVTCDELAQYPIGKLVTYQPGTRLVKLVSAPDVYAITPGGILRHVGSESQATALYGANWRTLVDDIPDEVWGSYRVGEPLEEGELPDGMILFQLNKPEEIPSRYYYKDVSGLFDITNIIDDVMNDRPSTVVDVSAYEIFSMTSDYWNTVKNLTWMR